MRFLGAIALALVMLGSGPVAAQVPDALFTGTARPITAAGTGSWCALEVGSSLFQRLSPKQALITLPPLHYAQTTASGGTYYALSGQGRMNFSNATSGTLTYIHPKTYPGEVLSPTFSNYRETYNAAKGGLEIRFQVRFPGCRMGVLANYRN